MAQGHCDADAHNFTGGRQTSRQDVTGAADEAYAAIRRSTTDVEAIARHTGCKSVNIQKVKQHLFYEEHLLDRYVELGVPAVMQRFDSDLSIANAWKRLEQGDFTEADRQLLRHEAAEAYLMRKWRDPSLSSCPYARPAALSCPKAGGRSMNVVKVGDVYKATRITGPQHNFLGLVLSEIAVESVPIEPLSVDEGEVAVETLDDQQVIEAVQRGVTKANEAFGTRFHVARLQYVPTDTPNPAVYSTLAKHIIEHVWREARQKEHAETPSLDS